MEWVILGAFLVWLFWPESKDFNRCQYCDAKMPKQGKVSHLIDNTCETCLKTIWS